MFKKLLLAGSLFLATLVPSYAQEECLGKAEILNKGLEIARNDESVTIEYSFLNLEVTQGIVQFLEGTVGKAPWDLTKKVESVALRFTGRSQNVMVVFIGPDGCSYNHTFGSRDPRFVTLLDKIVVSNSEWDILWEGKGV